MMVLLRQRSLIVVVWLGCVPMAAAGLASVRQEEHHSACCALPSPPWLAQCSCLAWSRGYGKEERETVNKDVVLVVVMAVALRKWQGCPQSFWG